MDLRPERPSGEITAAIVRAMAAGTLPHEMSLRMDGGPGDGKPCACCGEPVGQADIQYTVHDGQHDVRMHLRCYGLWCQVVRSR